MYHGYYAMVINTCILEILGKIKSCYEIYIAYIFDTLPAEGFPNALLKLRETEIFGFRIF